MLVLMARPGASGTPICWLGMGAVIGQGDAHRTFTDLTDTVADPTALESFADSHQETMARAVAKHLAATEDWQVVDKGMQT